MNNFIGDLIWRRRSNKSKNSKSNSATPADLALLPPPAVWSRVMIWTLATGSMSLFLWSVLTKVEETIVLMGEVTTENPGVQISARDAGVVTAVNVKPHQRVSAGQVLITYTDDETIDRLKSQLNLRQLLNRQQNQDERIFSLRRRQIEEQISLDRNLLERLETLRSVGAIQETQILEKRGQILKAELSLNTVEEEMRRSKTQSDQQMENFDQTVRELKSKKERFTVQSPVNGTVQEIRHQTSGERIQPSDLISVIIPDQDLMARVRIPSKLSAPIEVKTPASVDIDAFPASDHGSVEAIVTSVSPTTSQATGQNNGKSYEADLRLLGPQNPETMNISDLRPGMALTARIRLREKPVAAIIFNFIGDLFTPLTENR